MSSSIPVSTLRRFHRSTLHPRNTSRTMATKVERSPAGEGADFRPPWFYTVARVLSWTLIPATGFYGVFIYDFGDHEHVFQPARRWAERQKAAFLTLSAEEKKIVGNETASTKP
ncbi:hypothetical protein LshimejAT787_0503860 [Lyophyllum shimeji]|uniref:Uncharacterized protein n=1 Tax=Lyophyllum shimeji TaxID=47721 RepID=A0A9P3PNG7_LYOSH|nr:hypothetical protein LshimejAT787_0503860 [Lyophyllum shimeji]